MALADSIETYRVKHTGYICSTAKLISELTEADRNVLLNAIEKGVSTTTLVSALRAEGYKIGDDSLNKHRAGRCKCIANV